MGRKPIKPKLDAPQNQSTSSVQASGSSITLPDKELSWKHYELHIDLYKHYLELTVKFDAFYYAATGAILSFYFSKLDVGVFKYSLLFPLIMSVGFALVFIYAAILLGFSRKEVFRLRDELNLKGAPDLNILGVLLILSALLKLVVAAGLLWILLTTHSTGLAISKSLYLSH